MFCHPESPPGIFAFHIQFILQYQKYRQKMNIKRVNRMQTVQQKIR